MGRKILLAEDEVMLRELAVDALTDAGFEVLSAGDGQEALALLRSNSQIDLVISDVRMPNMDGVDLVRAGLRFRPDLKFVITTGYPADVPAELRARPIEVLGKPFNLNRLCEIAGRI